MGKHWAQAEQCKQPAAITATAAASSGLGCPCFVQGEGCRGSAVALLAVLRYRKDRMLPRRRKAEQRRRTDATAALGERMKHQQRRQQRPGKGGRQGAPLPCLG